MKTNKKDEKQKAKGPIIDGDTRPDQGVEPENQKRKAIDKDNKKVTTNRNDVNSLEDFRDAK
jgi:hypothetical protein